MRRWPQSHRLRVADSLSSSGRRSGSSRGLLVVSFGEWVYFLDEPLALSAQATPQQQLSSQRARTRRLPRSTSQVDSKAVVSNSKTLACRYTPEHALSYQVPPQCTSSFPMRKRLSSSAVWTPAQDPEVVFVRGWYIAMGQYSSLCGGAAVLTLGVVDMEDGVRGRVQVECGREEVNDGEKQEKDRTRKQPTDDQTHIMDDIKME